jgi:hypothetical protein
MARASEDRATAVARELLEIRGWRLQRPPRGNLLWKNEYREYPHLLEVLEGKAKTGKGGDAYPDFLIVSKDTIQPLIVGETKSNNENIDKAIGEACDPYGNAFEEKGFRVLAAGVAGDDRGNIAVQIKKHSRQAWQPVVYRGHPIQWLPTPEETERLLADEELFELQPRVPSNEILAKRGDEINRLLRDSKIKDEFRPAIIGAFMLGLWQSKGHVRMEPDYILTDINVACKREFIRAGKGELADSINVPEANQELALKARRICHILRVLNITTLTAEHDYLGQLYEMFFRFTGGNTIGQFFTPRHITQFMVDLCEVNRDDRVVDPTCGTGGFLIAALHRMIGNEHMTHTQINELVREHLQGFDSDPIITALCIANMILRGDGTTGITKGNCFTHKDYPEGTATVLVGNPPFPHKKTDTPAEKFVNRGLDALNIRGFLSMIVPGSLLVRRNKGKWRKKILTNNSLLGVFTFPSELFQPYASSTTAAIAIRKGVPHGSDTRTFFCRIANDGYRLRKNVRVEQSGSQLPDAMEAYRSGKSISGFCKTMVIPKTENEWAPGAFIDFEEHSIDELKENADFIIRGLVAFHANHAPTLSRFIKYLNSGGVANTFPYNEIIAKELNQLDKRADRIGNLFAIYYGQQDLENKDNLLPGLLPVISSQGTDNGCYGFFSHDEILAKLIKPPFVSVPRTGSIGESFVQILPCGVTSDCLLLIPREGTDFEDLFLTAAVLRLERWRFDYGRKMTPERIAHININRDSSIKKWIEKRYSLAQGLIQDILDKLMDEDEKATNKKKEPPGPKPELLKIEGDWREAVKKSLAKKKPPTGWPK